MATTSSIIQRAFASGELAPVLHARADTAKYTLGLRTCRNFYVRKEGGVSNRAGFRFVEACKTASYGTRLMPYVGSIAGESFLIEMGAGYFRFYTNGAAVSVSGVAAYGGATAYNPGDLASSGGVTYYAIVATTGNAPPNVAFWYPLPAGGLYEIPTPYTLATLPDWNQSGNVMTLTSPAHPPMELVFVDGTHWVLQAVTTAPVLLAPTGGAGVAGAGGTRTYTYVVTSAAADTFEESEGSVPIVIAACAEPTADLPNTLSWSADPLAGEYYVYADPYDNGVFGYIGTAASNSFNDGGIVPDFGLTPPLAGILFNAVGDYPSHSANYQQRRFFANTDSAPDAIWGSRTGFRSNYGGSSPLQDDDAVTFRLAGNNHHPIRHMAALKAGLVLMTDGGEWTLTGGNGPKSPITPSSIDATQETYVGIAENVRPAVVGNAILYVQSRGSVVRDLQFEQQVEGLAGRDLTIYASHLVKRRTIVALDYQQTPDSIVWCVRDDGVLLGLTYIPDQDIWGWHRHDTAGTFEDVCVIPEEDEDAVYVIVKRTILGAAVRYIEKLERRDLLVGYFNATMFFVDSGLSYSGAPADVFTGLDHLNGQRVAILADGVVVSDGATGTAYVVAGGSITIPAEASNVHIGLPIQYAEIETLDLDVQGSDLRDKHKRVGSVTLLIDESSKQFKAGPDATQLETYVPQTWDSTAVADTGQFEINLPSTFGKYGRVVIRMTDPLPLTVLAVVPNVETGS
jgi:hypothetical protein